MASDSDYGVDEPLMKVDPHGIKRATLVTGFVILGLATALVLQDAIRSTLSAIYGDNHGAHAGTSWGILVLLIIATRLVARRFPEMNKLAAHAMHTGSSPFAADMLHMHAHSKTKTKRKRNRRRNKRTKRKHAYNTMV